MLSEYFALRGGRTFTKQGHAGERGHRGGIAALGSPMTEFVLVVGEIVEAFANDFAGTRVVDGGASR